MFAVDEKPKVAPYGAQHLHVARGCRPEVTRAGAVPREGQPPARGLTLPAGRPSFDEGHLAERRESQALVRPADSGDETMRPFLFPIGEIHVGGTVVPLGIPSYGAAVLIGMLLGGVVWAQLGSRAYPEIPWRHLYLGTLASALIGAKLLQVVLCLPDIAAGRTSLVASL